MEPLSWADRLNWPPLAAEIATGERQRHLCEALRSAIWRGAVQAGDRLPASRALAAELGIGRNTVILAYEQLFSEGYLRTRQGAGTFVTSALPDDFHTVAVSPHKDGMRAEMAESERPLTVSRLAQNVTQAALRQRGRRSRATEADRVPFCPGVPALDVFPWALWGRCLARRWRSSAVAMVDDEAGFAPLRDAIAAFLRESRGVRCDAEQVIVVSGAQQALDLAARTLCDAGDRVLIEDPGFSGVDTVLLGVGAQAVPMPCDGEGMVIPSISERARAVLLTPSHSYPLGVTMTLARRLAWLSWARQAGAWIIEDDYDSDFQFCGKPLPALQGFDSDGRILYVGTFTRALFPSLRIGYLVVPDALIDAVRAVRRMSDGGGSIVAQAALADFMVDGHFHAHMRTTRRLYGERRSVVERFLREEMADFLRLYPADGGLHLTALLPTGWDDLAVCKHLFSEGLTTSALSPYYRGSEPSHGILLGYAGWSEERIQIALRHLKKSFNHLLSVPPIVR